MSRSVRVTLSATTGDPEIVARVAENFARTAAGLALEGVETWTSMYSDEEDES